MRVFIVLFCAGFLGGFAVPFLLPIPSIEKARPTEPRPAAEAVQPHAPLTVEPAGNSGSERVAVEAAEPGPPPRNPELKDALAAANEQIAVLERDLADTEALRYRLRQAELRAALEPDGQIGEWAATVLPASVPDEHTRLMMASLLHDYPVELAPEEGLWLVDRIQADDWNLWGASVDEAIVAFLGADRIAQARTP